MRKFPSEYTTTDTALAAFLAISDVRLINLDVSTHPVTYTFESNGNLSDLIMQWELELSPVRQFYNTYRSFIRQIKEHNG